MEKFTSQQAAVKVILKRGSKTKHAPKSFRVAEYQAIVNTLLKVKQSGAAISSPNAHCTKVILCSLGDVDELSIQRRIVSRARRRGDGNGCRSIQSMK